MNSESDARLALSEALPGQTEPWVLKSELGDAVAYFNIITDETDVICPAIQADISGKHFNKDNLVIEVLNKLQQQVGGNVTNDA